MSETSTSVEMESVNMLNDFEHDLSSSDEEEWSDYQHAVPSDWLLESAWRDSAYEEIMSIRDKHSFLVDEAYLDSYKQYFKENKIKGSVPLRLKKCLNFLGSSRREIGSLSKKKCHTRVMGIKHILARKDCVLDPLSLCASDQTVLPNWRDKIYEEIRSMRNEYSRELDEVLTEVNGVHTERLDEDKDYCKLLHFLCESVNFLSTCRADLALYPKEEDCFRKQLDGIKLFVEGADESVPAVNYAKLPELAGQSRRRILAGNGSTNWRDVAFDQLLYKKDRFIYEVYVPYLQKRVTWSKIPEFDEHVKRLESHLAEALGFYAMPRFRMSALKTEDDYFKLVDNMAAHLMDSMVMMNYLRRCLGEEINHCRPGVLFPKRKLCPEN